MYNSLVPDGHTKNHPFLRVLYNVKGYYKFWVNDHPFINLQYKLSSQKYFGFINKIMFNFVHISKFFFFVFFIFLVFFDRFILLSVRISTRTVVGWTVARAGRGVVRRLTQDSFRITWATGAANISVSWESCVFSLICWPHTGTLHPVKTLKSVTWSCWTRWLTSHYVGVWTS